MGYFSPKIVAWPFVEEIFFAASLSKKLFLSVSSLIVKQSKKLYVYIYKKYLSEWYSCTSVGA